MQKDMDIEHLRFLRSRLTKGEQKEIAAIVGVSHGYVRLVLGGFKGMYSPTAQEIVRVAQQRVYSRALNTLMSEIKPVLPYRPDFVELLKNEMEVSNTPFGHLSDRVSDTKIVQF